jgi:hypothetical protein
LEVDSETPYGAGITTPCTRTGAPLRYTPAGDGRRYAHLETEITNPTIGKSKLFVGGSVKLTLGLAGFGGKRGFLPEITNRTF